MDAVHPRNCYERNADPDIDRSGWPREHREVAEAIEAKGWNLGEVKAEGDWVVCSIYRGKECVTAKVGNSSDSSSQCGVLLTRLNAAASDEEPRQVEPDETCFPWHEITSRTRDGVQEHVMRRQGENRNNIFKQHKWPLSCESLVAAGPREIARARKVGAQGLSEIRDKLRVLGFEF